jgi:hypothetical protein
MFALDALDRRKPWYRWRRFRHDSLARSAALRKR